MKKLIAALLALASAAPAGAKLNIGSKKDVPHVDITVAKGETMSDSIVTSGVVSIAGKATEDVAVFGGPLTIDGDVLGDVASFGGPITVNGSVKGDVASFGGPVTINGDVKGEVASTGGDVTLGAKASIGGDLALLGGKLDKAEGAKIAGSVTSFDLKLAAKMAPLAKKWQRWAPEVKEELGVAGRVALFVGFLIFTACIGLLVGLVAAVLPQPVDAVAQSVKADFWGSAGVGVLMMLGFVPSIVALAASILGIPLIPLFLIASAAAAIMALAASSRLAGERLFESLQKPQPGNAAVAAVVGYALLVSLLVLGRLLHLTGGIGGPAGVVLVLAGLMVLAGSMIVGLGAVWRTRMGSRTA